MSIDRRDFIKNAAAMGASFALAGKARASRTRWRESREHFPEGVASGDPDQSSVILWTRRPYQGGDRRHLTVEVAEDQSFERVVTRARTTVEAGADWTARVLVGGLKPARVYWYRFIDSEGNGSRIGRTITAPHPDDARPVNFAFVSCQSVNEGKLNGYLRMIFEDERAAPDEQLGFVLHLGDFIYEVVQYPEEVATRYDRTIYNVARIPDGGKFSDFHYPLTVEGYRAVYRGYLADQDLQEARARWPFVCIWDNHEFAWQGRQSIHQAGGDPQPGQAIKVAANQAWFEFIPARVRAPGGSLNRFEPPAVENVKIETWDENGLGLEPNNLAAIRSLIAYRAFRYGRHLDLIITDQHSFCGDDPTDIPGIDKIYEPKLFNGMFSEEAMIALDAGRTHNGGQPPAEVSFRDTRIPNGRRDKAPRTILGAEQKAWFKDRLRRSTATWKIWGNSYGTLDYRADPQNLPPGFLERPWPSDTYAMSGSNDYGAAYAERTEIYDVIREAGITGFAIVSGDRHSFWAGYAAAHLPPRKFEPVGLSFVGASMTSPGAMESLEHKLPKDSRIRRFLLADRPHGRAPDWTYNMLLLHGVRSCMEYTTSFDRDRARRLSNPDLSPHLKFVDMGGHGYGKIRLSAEEMNTEFVCIPRPITRSERPDGGPLRYRVVHSARLWKAGEPPKIVQRVIEGDPGLSI